MSTFSLFFSLADPKSTIYRIIVNPNSPNYISTTYFTVPLYDECNFQVGYRTTIADCQQVDEKKYMVIQKNTNVIYNRGSISTAFVYLDDVPFVLTPPGIYTSSIVSTTGSYLGKTGSSTRTKADDGGIKVTIRFDN
jgi:hypothetical protein